eukprot:5739929-Lingulodinium_polyedra.AAC.1
MPTSCVVSARELCWTRYVLARRSGSCVGVLTLPFRPHNFFKVLLIATVGRTRLPSRTTYLH